MESPNAEYREGGGGRRTAGKLEHLSDQYKSMRDLLKVYGLSVSEDNNNPQKELNIPGTTIAPKALILPPTTTHPSDLLRGAFAEQLLFSSSAINNIHSPWLDLCRLSNQSHIDADNNSPPLPTSNSIVNGSRLAAVATEAASEETAQTLRRFESAAECGQIDCILQQLRDHYHCEDRYCVRPVEHQQPARRYLRTLCKKEEIIRHCKWHKKRAETLKFGFLRFSCMDDCQQRVDDGEEPDQAEGEGCQFNGKQTHYHCIETDCDKVYISTSDVQMHANYHRKTNAIRMQGFLRVRNLETCQEPACPYANQQTTHFHCLRDGCQFTFKNKGEMEKHKVYHLKDEQLLSDGFKKFFKGDKCKFANCRYDGKLNHIHCIRPNCNYVFHSSGQLMSHKRKHEKSEQQTNLISGVGSHNHLSDCDTSSVSADNSLLDLSMGVRAEGRSCGNNGTDGQSLNSLDNGTHFPTLHSVPHSLPPSTSAPGHHQHLKPIVNTPAGPNSSNNKVLQITSIDGLFNRKRGRPPKNRFVEVYNANHARTSYSPQNKFQGGAGSSLSPSESPQAIFASFKLDKSVTGGAGGAGMGHVVEESSRGSIRKKPKLVEQKDPKYEEEGIRREAKKPGVGLIKSTGIFFPNTSTPEPPTVVDFNNSVEPDVYHSTSSNESQGNSRQNREGACMVDKQTSKEDTTGRQSDEDGDENAEHYGNGSSNMDPFGVNSHEISSRNILSNPFVPNIFPVNVSAMEHNNNRETNGIMSSLGMEWLKYAYQQPNPLMVFATTAALLAASINTSSNPPGRPPSPANTHQQSQIEPQIPTAMDASILEYAKNMFIYNNFQQQQHQQLLGSKGASLIGNGLELTANGHSLDPSSSISPSSSSSTAAREQRSVSGFAKDEAIPAGYLKFRFNEDCQFVTCGYRNHQSHFHCLRDNCFYSFCDKTRFVQHTARHERLDKLMGCDFKQFRSNMNCGYEGCEFGAQHQQNTRQHPTDDDDGNTSGGGGGKQRNSSKSSHFHCQKCEYICTDTNKVVAHRRQHNKTDYIRLSGFRKVASAEPCYFEEVRNGGSPQEDSDASAAPPPAEGAGLQKCHYSGKQTHYHCLVCNGVVLNRSQLAVHRHKGQQK